MKMNQVARGEGLAPIGDAYERDARGRLRSLPFDDGARNVCLRT